MSLRSARGIGAMAAGIALCFAALAAPSAHAVIITDSTVAPQTTDQFTGLIAAGSSVTVTAAADDCIGAVGAAAMDSTGKIGATTSTVDATGGFVITLTGAILPAGGFVTLNVFCYDSTYYGAGSTGIMFGGFTAVNITVEGAAAVVPNVPVGGMQTITGKGFPQGQIVKLILHSLPVDMGCKTANASGIVTWGPFNVSNPKGDGDPTNALAPGLHKAELVPMDTSCASAMGESLWAPFNVYAPASGMPRLGSDVA